MPGRPKIFNEEEVIDKAIEVFWKKGYEGTSAEELLAAMEIGKGSFYLAFKGGKKELFERALEQKSKIVLANLQKELDECDDKLSLLKSFFYEVLNPKSQRYLNGCLMGNSVAELANINPDLKKKAANMLLRLEKLFLKTIKELQSEGILKTKENPEIIARYLLTAWNGLNISVRVYPEPKLLKPLIEKQLEILK